MALPSSGQISLSDIQTEFGGSNPIALSEYYGQGNAPSSGEIQLAADFYGTSSSLHSSTVTTGSRTIKAGVTEHGYSDAGSNSGTGSDSFGSITNTTISGTSITVSAVYFRHDTGTDVMRLAFSSPYSSWTTLTVGSQSFNRTDASAINNSGARFHWNYGTTSATNPFGSDGSSTAVTIT